MNVTIFLSGIYMATFAASGVFFIKFWKAARDRFFLFFGIACWLVAFERVALLFLNDIHNSFKVSVAEGAGWVYIIRLLAYALILYAIIEKNRPRKNGNP